MAEPSNRSLYASLAGTAAVAAVKFGAFLLSGSASMLVEAFHSVVDGLNGGLLLMGMHLSTREPDERHPFGYGMDSFFWTFIVGMLIFAAGGIASLYEGIGKLRHPQPVDHVPLTLAALALSFVFEALSFIVSWRESERGRPQLSRRRHRRVGLVRFIHSSPNPGVFEVLSEGLASLLGLLLAAAGVIGTALLGWRHSDGIAAIAIGVVLIALAAIVLAESKSLLTGEAVSAAIREGVCEILVADPRVSGIRELLSMYLGPHEILLAASLTFAEGTTAAEVRDISNAALAKLREVEPRVGRLFLRTGDA